ncbi:MAG: nucleoid-associated protein YejK [Cognaticolwellia sp.]|jgi:nucleoid-associated protein YejK
MFDCTECGYEFDNSLVNCPECDTSVAIAKRPELIALAAITTEFITQPGSSKLESKVGKKWPINEDICYNLISQVEKKFKRKNKFHSYYDESNDTNSTQVRLVNFILEKITFEKIVTLFMDSLIAKAREAGVSKVAGGNIIFMHYKSLETGDIGRLLAIMVDKKDGFDFDENLIPTDSQHINLEALRQAALFDLTLFEATYPEVPEDETYLKFIKGNSTGEFFKKAFGCEIKVDNGRSVSELRKALVDFQEHNKLSEQFYDGANKTLESMLAKAAKSKDSIAVTSLFDAIESHLPEGSSLKGTFGNFVNTREYEINHHIEPTDQNVKDGKWVDVNASDESFKAKIYRSKIGASGSGKLVEYDEEKCQLILNVTDKNTRKALSKLVKKDE